MAASFQMPFNSSLTRHPAIRGYTLTILPAPFQLTTKMQVCRNVPVLIEFNEFWRSPWRGRVPARFFSAVQCLLSLDHFCNPHYFNFGNGTPYIPCVSITPPWVSFMNYEYYNFFIAEVRSSDYTCNIRTRFSWLDSICIQERPSRCVSKIDTEKSVKHNKRWFLLLHKATSFDSTMGSSSGDYIRVKENDMIYDMIYDMIWYIYIYVFNCNWVDTRWQQYSSHLHTNSTQNTPNRTYITITN
jgi:hypothetical protein